MTMCRKPLYINGFRDLASRNLRQFLGVFYSLGPQMVPIAKDNNFLLCNIPTIFWLAEILNKYPVKKTDEAGEWRCETLHHVE